MHFFSKLNIKLLFKHKYSVAELLNWSSNINILVLQCKIHLVSECDVTSPIHLPMQ